MPNKRTGEDYLDRKPKKKKKVSAYDPNEYRRKSHEGWDALGKKVGNRIKSNWEKADKKAGGFEPNALRGWHELTKKGRKKK